MLTREQKQAVIRAAKQSVETELGLGQGSSPGEKSLGDLASLAPGGVFVTWYKKGELRGCIGSLRVEKSFAETLSRVAVESAFDDPRFLPLQADEYPDVTVEVSLLSPPAPVESADQIVPGRHGVWIRKGPRSGLLLPQVWEDMPDKEVFLNALCAQKAGLEERSWLDPETELKVFTAEIISEKDLS